MSIADLPYELVCAIAEDLGKDSHNALMRASRRLHDYLEPDLYKRFGKDAINYGARNGKTKMMVRANMLRHSVLFRHLAMAVSSLSPGTVQYVLDQNSVLKEWTYYGLDENGLSPIYEAVRTQRVNVLQRVLSCPVSRDHVNVPSHSKGASRSPLLLAVRNGSTEMVGLLLRHSADPTVRDRFTNLPIMTAAEHGYDDIFRLLLAYGGPGNGDDITQVAQVAARRGALQQVKMILEHEDIDCTSFLHSPASIVYAAVGPRRQSCDLIDLLVAHGALITEKEHDRTTPIHKAAELGLLRVVEKLMEHGADPSDTDHEGRTPLHYAAQNGHVDVLTLLVNNTPRSDYRDIVGYTPMILAVIMGHATAFCLLRRHQPETLPDFVDNAGMTLLHWAGNTEMARSLLRHGADPNAKSFDGTTPFLMASGRGMFLKLGAVRTRGFRANVADPLLFEDSERQCSVALMKLLLASGACVSISNERGETPLYYAAASGNTEAVKLLLKHNVNVSAVTKSNNCSALTQAAHYGWDEIVKLLVKNGAEVNEMTWTGETPLSAAAQSCSMSSLRLLLARRVDPTNSHRIWARALRSGLPRAMRVELLLDYDVDSRTLTMDQVLRQRKEDSLDVIKVLHRYGVSINATLSPFRPVQMAVHSADVLSWFMEHGASIDINHDGGARVLNEAVEFRAIDSIKLLLGRGGVNPNGPTGQVQFQTHLHRAAYHGQVDIAKVLLDHGASIDRRDGAGCAPLHLAATRDRQWFIEAAVRRGADVEAMNTRGETPMFLALKNHALASVKILLWHGANLWAADNWGRTGIEVARSEPKAGRDMIRWLEKEGLHRPD